MVMPEMDGVEFVKRLDGTIPVIFYTASHTAAEARRVARECGAAQVLMKPSEPDVILKSIELALGRSARPTPAIPAFERLQIAALRAGALVDFQLEIAAQRCANDILRILARAARVIIASQHSVVIGEHGAARRLDHDACDAAASSASIRVPLETAAQRYGWLTLTGREGGDDYDADDERIALTLAAQAAVAYENLKLYDEIRMEADLLNRNVNLLHATIEAGSDGILVIDRESRFVTFNQKFAEIMHLPANILDSGDADRSLAHSLTQVKDPEALATASRRIRDTGTMAGTSRSRRPLRRVSRRAAAAGRRDHRPRLERARHHRARARRGGAAPERGEISRADRSRPGRGLDRGRRRPHAVHQREHRGHDRLHGRRDQRPRRQRLDRAHRARRPRTHHGQLHRAVRRAERVRQRVPLPAQGRPLDLDARLVPRHVRARRRALRRRRHARRHRAQGSRGAPAQRGPRARAAARVDRRRLFAIDVDGVCTMANHVAATLLGRPVEELIGSRIHHLIHRGESFSVRKTERDSDDTFLRSDGAEFPVAYISSPIVDAGVVRGTVVSFVDISERRRLEQRIEQISRIDSLGRMAATIAHEFNNVLMGIQPFAEVIRRKGGADPALQKAAGHILNSVARGKGITQDILRISKAAEPQLRAVDLVPWLEQLVAEIRALVGPRVNVELDAPAWTQLCVRCDPRRCSRC